MQEAILRNFHKVVTSQFISEVARKVKFNQRSTSQVSGINFTQMLILQAGSGAAMNYSNLNAYLSRINRQIDISNQALSEYFYKQSSSELLKSVCEKVFLFQKEMLLAQRQKNIDQKTLDFFNRILTQDSTTCILDKKLALKYKGSGGCASQSGLKIDVIHELKTAAVIKINIVQASTPDVIFASSILRELLPGDLVLRDLGYFKADEFQEIKNNNAYFISRYKKSINVYIDEESKTPVSLGKLLKAAYDKFPTRIFENTVFLGPKKLQVRLIAYKVPPEIANKRRRKARRESVCHGCTASEERLNLCDFVILITNISPEVISSELIGTIYRIRWGIELIFKTWKSQFNLQKSLKGHKETRVLCFVYATLIVCLITSLIHGWLKKISNLMGKEISLDKLSKWLRYRNACYQILFGTTSKVEDEIRKHLRELKKQKRRRKTTLERVACSEAYEEKYAANVR